MATTATPTKADLHTARELDAMAEQIDPCLTDAEMHACNDLDFGLAVAKSGAARQLRVRAAELRQEPCYL